MRFYMTPGSCSTGIHILLEECELLFEAHVVDLLAGAHRSPEFLALNPRGSVPTLVCDDGRVLTSFQAIADFVAEAHPNKRLLPEDAAEATRVRQVMDYAVSVIHGEGFTRVFVSDRYAIDPDGRSQVEREGRNTVSRGFERLQPMLRGPGYVSERFSLADAAVFYVEFWAERVGIPLPPACQRHLETMLTRGPVRQVLAEEGYASVLRDYPITRLRPVGESSR